MPAQGLVLDVLGVGRVRHVHHLEPLGRPQRDHRHAVLNQHEVDGAPGRLGVRRLVRRHLHRRSRVRHVVDPQEFLVREERVPLVVVHRAPEPGRVVRPDLAGRRARLRVVDDQPAHQVRHVGDPAVLRHRARGTRRRHLLHQRDATAGRGGRPGHRRRHRQQPQKGPHSVHFEKVGNKTTKKGRKADPMKYRDCY
eukprot:144153_1